MRDYGEVFKMPSEDTVSMRYSRHDTLRFFFMRNLRYLLHEPVKYYPYFHVTIYLTFANTVSIAVLVV